VNAPQQASYSLWTSFRFWFILGWTSFGGPAAQIAMMQAELVEKRRWISPHRFVHALNYCMVLPGPEAQQLATYMGWLLHGPLGGIIAGTLFILPSLGIMTGFGYLYVSYGEMPEVQALLYGLKPAVLAIVVAATLRLGQRVLNGPLWWGIATGALVLLLLNTSFVVVIGLAALVGWVAYLFSKTPLKGMPTFNPLPLARDPRVAEQLDHGYLIDDHSPPPKHARADSKHLLSALGLGLALWALLFGAVDSLFGGVLASLSLFFTKVALITFGGAYAVLPYVFDVAVSDKGWVTTPQMMDALALGETTPGPLVMVNAFIGYLTAAQHTDLTQFSIPVAGALGAVIVTVFTFLPSFVFILAGAPWVEASRRIPSVIAPLTAISAAVVAIIADLAVTFAGHILWPTYELGLSWRTLDIVALLLSVLAIVLMLVFRMGMLKTMIACVAMGLVASVLGLP